MPAALRDLPDEDLMLAYAAGDAAAFDVLYARHEAGLYRFVRRLLGAPLSAQADEVFQDTWMRIVAVRASFVPQGAAWRTWAFTIAHNGFGKSCTHGNQCLLKLNHVSRRLKAHTAGPTRHQNHSIVRAGITINHNAIECEL